MQFGALETPPQRGFIGLHVVRGTDKEGKARSRRENRVLAVIQRGEVSPEGECGVF